MWHLLSARNGTYNIKNGFVLKKKITLLANMHVRSLWKAVRPPSGGGGIPRKSRLLLTNGLILSRVLYLLPLYGVTHEKYMNKIQVVMNNAICFVTGMNKRTKKRTLMEEVGWLDVYELQEFHSMLLAWRVLRLRAPAYLAEKLTLDSENKLSTNHLRLQNTMNSFRWKIVSGWNRLSAETRSEQTYKKFKSAVKKEIILRRPP